jgi:hypothetical protein
MSAPVSHFTRASRPNDGIGIAFAPGTREPESVTGHLGPYGITPLKAPTPEQSFVKRYDMERAPPP